MNAMNYAFSGCVVVSSYMANAMYDVVSEEMEVNVPYLSSSGVILFIYFIIGCNSKNMAFLAFTYVWNVNIWIGGIVVTYSIKKHFIITFESRVLILSFNYMKVHSKVISFSLSTDSMHLSVTFSVAESFQPSRNCK